MKYLILFSALLFLSNSNIEKEQKKFALLIGNGNYTFESYESLTNPLNDVDSMEMVLTKLGFTVIKKKNCDKDQMDKYISDFVNILRDNKNRGYETIGLFYYAGHGNHVNKDNESYLIPLKSNVRQISDFKSEAYKVSKLLNRLEEVGNYLNIIMLDACRNNPSFKSMIDKQYTGHNPFLDMFEGTPPPKNNHSKSKRYSTLRIG